MALEILQSKLLSNIPDLLHGFTTRKGGVSEGGFSTLNFGTTVGDRDEFVAENYERLASHLNIRSDQFISCRQVHGADVYEVASIDNRDKAVETSADALISSMNDVMLSVRTADCYSILLVDRQSRAIAAIHSGWRGTLARIVNVCIAHLKQKKNVIPTNLYAAIGPGIGMANYEVSLGVASLFENEMKLTPDHLKIEGNSAHLNLQRIIRDQLLEGGVPLTQIDSVGACTFEDKSRFFSYRRDGKKSGRNLSFVGWAA